MQIFPDTVNEIGWGNRERQHRRRSSCLSTLRGVKRTSWQSPALHSRLSGAISTKGYTLHVGSMKWTSLDKCKKNKLKLPRQVFSLHAARSFAALWHRFSQRLQLLIWSDLTSPGLSERLWWVVNTKTLLQYLAWMFPGEVTSIPMFYFFIHSAAILLTGRSCFYCYTSITIGALLCCGNDLNDHFKCCMEKHWTKYNPTPNLLHTSTVRIGMKMSSTVIDSVF